MKPIRFKYERADKSERFDDGFVEDHPHGFVLKMWGEENVVTGVVVPMSNGKTDVVLVCSQVDNPISVIRMSSEKDPGTKSSFGKAHYSLREEEAKFERFLTEVARKATQLIAGEYVTPESRVIVENAVLKHLLRAYA